MSIQKKYSPMEISSKQLIQNPGGKGSAYLVRRDIARGGIQSLYLTILKKFKHAVKIQGFKIKETESIVYFVQVPSEGFKYNKLTYTVVIKIDNSEKQKNKLFVNKPVQYYSNSPAYYYIYAYVMYHRSLVPRECEILIPNIFKTKAPKIKNPVESLGWEKTFYIAARVLIENGYLSDKYIANRLKYITTIQLEMLVKRIPSMEHMKHYLAVGRKIKQARNKNARVQIEKSDLKAALRSRKEIQRPLNSIGVVKTTKPIKSKLAMKPKKAKISISSAKKAKIK